MSARLAATAALLCTTLVLVAPGRAEAICKPPPPKPLWSWPVDGATDVPTDSAVFVIVGLGSDVSVSLDGSALSPSPVLPWLFTTGKRFDKGSTHSVDIDITETSGGDAERTSLSFTVGDGPSDASVASFRVTGHDLAVDQRYDGTDACFQIFGRQECFDTGQNSTLTLQTEGGEDALLFVLDGHRAWPAECGAPTDYDMATGVDDWPGEAYDGCVKVQAVTASGRTSQSSAHCVRPGTAPAEDATGSTGDGSGSGGASPESDGGGGCTSGRRGSPAGAWLLVLVAAYAGCRHGRSGSLDAR